MKRKADCVDINLGKDPDYEAVINRNLMLTYRVNDIQGNRMSYFNF